MKNWGIYILQCSDNTLYTGITTNLKQRLKTHAQGKGAKYTRGRLPVKLVWSKPGLSESKARKMEAKIKKLSKKKKQALIKTTS